MSQVIDLGDDDSVVDIVCEGDTVSFDVFRTFTKLADFEKTVRGHGEEAKGEAMLQYVRELGLPAKSVGMAVKFVNKMTELYLQKKSAGSTAPTSPASTTSPPAA